MKWRVVIRGIDWDLLDHGDFDTDEEFYSYLDDTDYLPKSDIRLVDAESEQDAIETAMDKLSDDYDHLMTAEEYLAEPHKGSGRRRPHLR